MFVVDTNIFIYAAVRQLPEHARARAVVERWAVLMREHGLREIRTADADFHQFRFLRVVNPIT